MFDLGIGEVMAITVIAYLIGEAVKAAKLPGRWIPIVCGASGMALGVVGMYLMPEFPAGDLLSAAAVGIVSGLAATGLNQTVRKLRREESV